MPERGYRRDVHDGAAAGASHRVDRRARAEHRPGQIGLNGVRPVLERLARTKWGRRVVDEDRHASERSFTERDELARLALVTHVRTLEYGASSFAFDETNRLVPARVVDVGDDDGGPVARESVGDRASASGAAGAGHDHDLIAAIVHASFSYKRFFVSSSLRGCISHGCIFTEQ